MYTNTGTLTSSKISRIYTLFKFSRFILLKPNDMKTDSIHN